MNLTLGNWSYKNIKETIIPLCHLDKVRLAVFCAEQVIDIYQEYDSDNKAPRLAIEAAKAFIGDPSESNRQTCKKAADAAYAAYAAADAADVAYADAAYAAYAAAYAAYAAYTAAYTAYAAYAAYAAANAAAKTGIKTAILHFLKNLFNPQKEGYIMNALPIHQAKLLGTLLIKEWQQLEQVKKNHPDQSVCFVTLVQCFNQIGLNRITDILNLVDTEFLLTNKIKRQDLDNIKFDYANNYLNSLK